MRVSFASRRKFILLFSTPSTGARGPASALSDAKEHGLQTLPVTTQSGSCPGFFREKGEERHRKQIETLLPVQTQG